ncbi:MAG: hypothetical protein KDD84_07015 [Caldilineaceae bacterium]|nr:hypothetical protein [Caldilineaceae bacterium]
MQALRFAMQRGRRWLLIAIMIVGLTGYGWSTLTSSSTQTAQTVQLLACGAQCGTGNGGG